MSTDPARQTMRYLVETIASGIADSCDADGGRGTIPLPDGRILIVHVIHPDPEPQP